MKQSTIYGLMVGVFPGLGMVACATILQAHGSLMLSALLAAQAQTPALWMLDAAACYMLLLSAFAYRNQMRMQFIGNETATIREQHKAQLEAILTQSEKSEELNASQMDQIAALQEQLTLVEAQSLESETQIDALNRQLAAGDERLASQLRKVAERDEQLAQQRSELSARDAEIVAHAARISTQTKQIAALTDQVDHLVSELNARTEQVAEQAKRIEAQAEQIQDLAIRLASAEARNTDLLGQVQTLTAENQRLTDRVAVLEVELAEERSAYEAERRRLTEQAFRMMAEQVDRNSRQIDAVNRMLQQQQSELERMQYERLAVAAGADPARIAGATPDELAILTAGEAPTRQITAGDAPAIGLPPKEDPSKTDKEDKKDKEDAGHVEEPAAEPTDSSGWHRKL